jgi:hypothetical protein
MIFSHKKIVELDTGLSDIITDPILKNQIMDYLKVFVKYDEKNGAYAHQYYKNNSEKIKLKTKKYYEENKEKINKTTVENRRKKRLEEKN